MNWFLSNWQAVIEIILMILGAGSLIAKLTPNTIDDLWIGRIIGWVGLTKKIK